MRYINRNAVRAKMVSKPGDWKYSGYRFYAFGESNELLDLHPTYLGLAENEDTRRLYYQRFVCRLLPDEDVREPQLSEGRYIGSPQFGQKLGLERESRGRKPFYL
jgi:putative transposase